MWWKKNKAEVCGYLDKYGNFYQDKNDRDLSNLQTLESELQKEVNKIFNNAVNS